jgi:glycosyltransferase involved in cell wall biosynthesis
MTAPKPIEIPKTIRAVFVAHTAAPSGAELATLRLLSALRKFHSAPAADDPVVEPSVILTEDGPMAEKMRGQGIPTSVLANNFDSRSVTIHGSGWLRRLSGAAALVRVGWSLGAAARDLGADILVAGSTKALIMSAVAAARARIPLIWQVHDRISAEYFGRAMALVIRMLGWVVSDGYLANSRSTAETLLKRDRRTVVAYPGLDFSRIADGQRAPQRPGPDTVIAVIGRLTPWKGQDLFLRALAQTTIRPRQVYLVGGTFFGEESFQEEVQDLARELRLPVVFTGHVDDPTDILLGSDILVHCSVIAEPFGQVVVEGLHAGCAVIATQPGGPAETVEPEVSGLLVDAGDTAGLTGALNRLMADPQLRTRLARAGQLRAQQFDIVDSARTVAGFLSDILATRRTRLGTRRRPRASTEKRHA